jgi:acetylglutamate kinase
MLLSTSRKTEVLIEALPYIQQYEEKTFVIKYGGAAMVDDDLKEAFAQDVTILKKIGIRIVIVHGGGKDITDIAGRLGIESRFVAGQRYTDPAMMEVVQMVLGGKTNKDIVARINQHDGGAVGICGIDNMLFQARKLEEGGADLGLVGEIVQVNTAFLDLLFTHEIMPVIAPIGVDDKGQAYNINADIAAGSVAKALKAEKLVYLSDVEGVMANGELVPSIDRAHAELLVKDGVISSGMLPKINSAFDALAAGVRKIHIIDGRVKHSLLLEIFTDEGVGTEVVQ